MTHLNRISGFAGTLFGHIMIVCFWILAAMLCIGATVVLGATVIRATLWALERIGFVI